jgi:hypothetical protein
MGLDGSEALVYAHDSGPSATANGWELSPERHRPKPFGRQFRRHAPRLSPAADRGDLRTHAATAMMMR